MSDHHKARSRRLDAARVVVTAVVTVAVLGTDPGSSAPPIRTVPQRTAVDPAEDVATRFLRAVVVGQSLDVCSVVTPNLGWVNPCLDELTRREDRLVELRGRLSPEVRVSPGVATSPTRVDFTAEQLEPRPDGLVLSLTVERDHNGDWRVTRLDDVRIPSG